MMAKTPEPGADGKEAASAQAAARRAHAQPPLRTGPLSLFEELTPDPEANIQTIVTKTFALLKGTSCCYCRFREDKTVLRAWQGRKGAPAPSRSKPLRAALCYNLLKASGNRPLALDNIHTASFKGTGPDLSHVGCTSFLGCPVGGRHEILGALCVFDSHARSFSESEIRTTALMAKMLAVEEARLEKELELKRGMDTKEKELARKTARLEDMNRTLSVLFKKRNEDIGRLEARMAHNIRELIDPAIRRLEKTDLNAAQRKWLDFITANLNEIASPLVSRLSSGLRNLTPTEIRIAGFIKHGKTNKDISEMLAVSIRTVEVHRCNIRRKLGIRKRGANLRTYLLAMEDG